MRFKHCAGSNFQRSIASDLLFKVFSLFFHSSACLLTDLTKPNYIFHYSDLVLYTDNMIWESNTKTRIMHDVGTSKNPVPYTLVKTKRRWGVKPKMLLNMIPLKVLRSRRCRSCLLLIEPCNFSWILSVQMIMYLLRIQICLHIISLLTRHCRWDGMEVGR